MARSICELIKQYHFSQSGTRRDGFLLQFRWKGEVPLHGIPPRSRLEKSSHSYRILAAGSKKQDTDEKAEGRQKLSQSHRTRIATQESLNHAPQASKTTRNGILSQCSPTLCLGDHCRNQRCREPLLVNQNPRPDLHSRWNEQK